MLNFIKEEYERKSQFIMKEILSKDKKIEQLMK
jgi:hypothetical protein